MRRYRDIKLALFAAAVCLAVAGCLPVSVKDRKGATTSGTLAATTGSSSSSVAAFQASVYPLVTAHCASCHAATNQPFFATADVRADHDAIVNNGKVNLDAPASSRLVQRLGQDNHNCWSTCSSNAMEMQNAIATWASMIKTAPPTASSTSTSTTTTVTPAPRMNTIEVLVPANIPGPGGMAFSTLSFPLANATDTIVPDVTDATFLLDIQKFDAFSYLVRNPRIQTTTSAVYVSDVRIAINGVIRANDTTYSLVDQIVPIGTTILSPASLVTLMDKGVGVDKLAISFVQVKVAAASGCKNLAGWQSSVKPVMQTSCVRCHVAGNKFDMASGTDAAICARTLGRVDTAFPSNSKLVTYPLTGNGHDGGGNLINQTTANSWVNWITTER
jgi:hypothetical protein